jgi:hypothetical protein
LLRRQAADPAGQLSHGSFPPRSTPPPEWRDAA